MNVRGHFIAGLNLPQGNTFNITLISLRFRNSINPGDNTDLQYLTKSNNVSLFRSLRRTAGGRAVDLGGAKRLSGRVKVRN